MILGKWSEPSLKNTMSLLVKGLNFQPQYTYFLRAISRMLQPGYDTALFLPTNCGQY